MKLSDRVTVGTISGLTGGTTALVVKNLLYRAGKVKSTWPQRAANVTVSKAYSHTKEAINLGTLIALTLSAALGVGQTYFLTLTGKDSLLLKNTGYGLLSWIAIHGLGSRLTKTFHPKDSPPASALSSLLGNLLECFISGEMISRLANPSIFPNRSTQENEDLRQVKL